MTHCTRPKLSLWNRRPILDREFKNMTLCELIEAAIAQAEGEVKEALEAVLAQAGCVAVANSGGGPGGVDPDKDK